MLRRPITTVCWSPEQMPEGTRSSTRGVGLGVGRGQRLVLDSEKVELSRSVVADARWRSTVHEREVAVEGVHGGAGWSPEQMPEGTRSSTRTPRPHTDLPVVGLHLVERLIALG